MGLSDRINSINEGDHYEKLVHNLTSIGIKLSAEKDIDKLLALILKESMNIAQSDAGSIYVKEGEPPHEILRFKYTNCESKDFPFDEFVLPINKKSIAGACAYLGEVLNFTDMAETIEKLGIEHNKTFDQSIGYSTRNMLVIPMKNYSGNIIGVMQLINKKRIPNVILSESEDFDRYIIPFSKDEEAVIESLSSQAAILIERSVLYQEIETQFSSFIECLVTSLDQRDPVTAGHSKRVADYAVQLAKDLTSTKSGPYATTKFTPQEIKGIYYAGLLHDVGKIGVSEYVLTKVNKLSDNQMTIIKYKFNLLKCQLEERIKNQTISDLEEIIYNSIDDDYKFLETINTSGFLSDENAKKVQTIGKYSFYDIDGIEKPILSPEELEMFMIVRGNLNSKERAIIESHPEHTFNVLSDIVWSRDLKNVPKIASEHHEKLDGTGYPKGIDKDKLSLQSRILCIVDIFDALTANDRPYKPAIPLDKTIEILNYEVKYNHLDKDLMKIFLDSKSYHINLGGTENERI